MARRQGSRRGNENDHPDEEQEADVERDITTTRILPPIYFRDENFAERNISIITEYADYRVLGWNPERAFCRVFGTAYADYFLEARIQALEHNVVYRKVFAAKFGATKLDDMFDAKTSVYELLSLVNNPFTKDTTRLTAIKELNIMFGITVIDENGKTRAGKTLSEFYTDTAKLATNPEATRHPEPGSAEAKAFMDKRDARIAGRGAADVESGSSERSGG